MAQAIGTNDGDVEQFCDLIGWRPDRMDPPDCCTDRYWPKADPHFAGFRGDRTSALRPEADIPLILPFMTAFDPKRTWTITPAHECLRTLDGRILGRKLEICP